MNTEIEAAAAAVGSKATYSGVVTIGFGWFLSSEFAVLIGMVLGLAGFGVNWFYKHKHLKLAQLEHEEHMRRIEPNTVRGSE